MRQRASIFLSRLRMLCNSILVEERRALNRRRLDSDREYVRHFSYCVCVYIAVPRKKINEQLFR